MPRARRVVLSMLVVLAHSVGVFGSDSLPGPERARLDIAPSEIRASRPCCTDLGDSRDSEGLMRVPENPPAGDRDLLGARKLEAMFSPSMPAGVEAGSSEMAPESLAPDVISRFEGIDILTVIDGYIYWPPDTQLAVGPGVLMEATNGGLLLAPRSGANPKTIGLQQFFDQRPGAHVFDPRAFYDRFTRRFIVIAVARSEMPRQSVLFMATSLTDRPEGFGADDWCFGEIDIKVGNTWGDYPSLGVNERWTVFSVNNFEFDTNEFVEANVYAAETTEFLSSQCTGGSVMRFPVATDPSGQSVSTLQAAKHLSRNGLPGAPLYLVSRERRMPSSDYTVWSVSGTDLTDVSLVGATVTTSGSYDVPPPGPQLGGPDLDTGGSRITDAVYRSGRLWAVHATGCALGPIPNESCIRTVEFAPSATGVSSTFAQNMGNAGWYYYWPGVALNLDGDLAIAFQRSRADRYLDIAFTGRPAGAERFEPPKSLQLGQCPLMDNVDDDRYRTGDYVGIQVDPGDNRSFWLAGEFAKELPIFGCRWGTSMGRVEYLTAPVSPGSRAVDALSPVLPSPAPGPAVLPSGGWPQLGGVDDRPDRERPKIR